MSSPTTTNWKNKTVFTGDNLNVLRGMNSESVDLVYLDPPFNSNKSYSAPIGSIAAGAAFKDTWTLDDVDDAEHGLLADKHPALYKTIDAARHSHSTGMMSYLIMMTSRLIELKRIMKPSASIYLHCDQTASHYLKLLMDSVFHRNNFRNEIVWSYQRWTGATKHFQRMHDTILFYAASKNSTYNMLREEYSAKSKHKGARHSSTQDGKVIGQSYTGDTSRMKAMRDVWEVSYLNSQAKERTGYPTQKPLELMYRIIRASSNEGDTILDPFCGCATTLVAAELLNRQWIGIDISSMAVKLVAQRVEKAQGLYKDITSRDDIPSRTDQGKIKRYSHKDNKHFLYGKQMGNCVGCNEHFGYRHFAVDHFIAQSKGGGDEIANLQLLCGSCNTIKGSKTQAELIATLRSKGIIK